MIRIPSRNSRLRQIDYATRGRLGAMFKSGVFIVLIGGAFMLALKTLDGR